MGAHNEFGKKGEALAAEHLQNKGFEILNKNYRYRKAEIDIIARKEDVIVVVEVKSRSSGFLEDISDMVSRKKRKRLVMAADQYVRERDLEGEVRFDLITITKNSDTYQLEHTEDAFYHF